MKGYNKDKGFSLVELIVVIAVMVLLIGIIVPQFLGYVERTKRATDDYSIAMLNRITGVYAADNDITTEDIFEGFNTEVERIQELIDAGLLGFTPEPKMDNAEFAWHIPTQAWYSTIYEDNIGNANSAWYNFLESSLEDYIITDNWTIGDNGFISSFGRLFIENPNEEYTISVKAKLDDGNGGGYGIFFESKYATDENYFNNSKDTGYIVQFDRGANGIKIDYRDGLTTSQGAYNSGDMFYHSDSEIIPSNRNDPWWSEEHEITMDVSHVDQVNNIKSMTLSIDGQVVIEDYEFESNVTAADNHTGFRSWVGNGSTTEYKELKITAK